jgi:hypothetical protein
MRCHDVSMGRVRALFDGDWLRHADLDPIERVIAEIEAG